jgi:hypothetical protein
MSIDRNFILDFLIRGFGLKFVGHFKRPFALLSNSPTVSSRFDDMFKARLTEGSRWISTSTARRDDGNGAGWADKNALPAKNGQGIGVAERVVSSNHDHFFGLFALWPLHQFIFHFLPFIQSLEAVHLD